MVMIYCWIQFLDAKDSAASIGMEYVSLAIDGGVHHLLIDNSSNRR